MAHRYIDADEAEQKGWLAVRQVKWETTISRGDEPLHFEVWAKPISALPTCDVVEVVRCRDCRYHEDEEVGMVYCATPVGGWVNDNWFCADGEKMDEVEE